MIRIFPVHYRPVMTTVLLSIFLLPIQIDVFRNNYICEYELDFLKQHSLVRPTVELVLVPYLINQRSVDANGDNQKVRNVSFGWYLAKNECHE